MPILCASLAAWFWNWFAGGVWQTLWQLLLFAAPLGGLALWLHWLELQTQYRLARRFGWNSVLWTGWLGTPIHELSHALFCLVFRHRVRELALFEPDLKTGRLGYVAHSFDPRSTYQVVGNFFIGVAPLLGGSTVLAMLLWLFHPEAARQALATEEVARAAAEGAWGDALYHLLGLLQAVLGELLTLGNLASPLFWLFAYLVLCVGGHMAPSGSDYQGAWWGGLLLLALTQVANWGFLLFGGDSAWLFSLAARGACPLLALYALCGLLCGLTSLAVVGALELVDVAFGPATRRR